MKKQTQKKRKISKKKLLDKQRIQYTIQDILLEKLDSEIRGFRDIRWRVNSKKYRDYKEVKYTLLKYITDIYFRHTQLHNQNTMAHTFWYKDLRDDLGNDYMKYMEILFDIMKGHQGGSTYQYKLKDEVVKICDEVYYTDTKNRGLIGRDGKRVEKVPTIPVRKYRDGEITKLAKHRHTKQFDTKVKLNEINVWVISKLFKDLLDNRLYKTKKIDRWTEIMNNINIDVNDMSIEKLMRLNKKSLELWVRINLAVVGEGYFQQLYTEKDSGRLYGEGWLNLQTLEKEIRYIVMGGLGYYEYDMINAHYNILYQYNRLTGGVALDTMKYYIENTEKVREELSKSFGIEKKLTKRILLAYCYGHKLDINGGKYDTDKKRRVDTELLGRIIEYVGGNRNDGRFIGKSITENKFIIGLHKEIDLAYNNMKTNWITKYSGDKERLVNPFQNEIMMKKLNKDTGKYIRKSKGQLLSFILQGIEAMMLDIIINEEGKGNFIMAHHDGWVSKTNHNTKRLEKTIRVITDQIMNKYNGIDGGFAIGIKKIKLNNPIETDWVDEIKNLTDETTTTTIVKNTL
jgi:hypothetical protein|tara:strand:+ start:325 stop:2037 length:1713 start_codon:yes stop_codon:yes gene_type:complete